MEYAKNIPVKEELYFLKWDRLFILNLRLAIFRNDQITCIYI